MDDNGSYFGTDKSLTTKIILGLYEDFKQSSFLRFLVGTPGLHLGPAHFFRLWCRCEEYVRVGNVTRLDGTTAYFEVYI